MVLLQNWSKKAFLPRSLKSAGCSGWETKLEKGKRTWNLTIFLKQAEDGSCFG